MRKLRGFVAAVSLVSLSAFADPAGAPGIPFFWPPAAKQAVGSSFEPKSVVSPVWFTVAEGILTEVSYPNVDTPQIADLHFIVTDGERFFSSQRMNVDSRVEYADEGLATHIYGKDRSGAYSFDEWLVTDTATPTVRVHVDFHFNRPGLRVFFLLRPAIDNAGMKSMGIASDKALIAGSPRAASTGSGTTAVLAIQQPWRSTSVGYAGKSDGLSDLLANLKLTETSRQAGPGHIVLTGEAPLPNQREASLDLALSFGQSMGEAQTYANTALSVAFPSARANYESGWKAYLDFISSTPLGQKRFIRESVFARRSAQLIKIHEDKRNKGAIVASLNNPAIPNGDHADDGVGGYHLIWPRDLYHAAMGLLAAGDHLTPVDVFHYLVSRQLPDGSWPQNFWVDGRPYWPSLQMDEIAAPILLASQLVNRTPYRLSSAELESIRRAASFILSHGPTTPQERWEEIGGYSPSTLAAMIAALRQAALLTRDPAPLATANEWQTLIERWTLVSSGPLGSNYYLRISPAGTPNQPEKINISNGGGPAMAWDIVDSGFLELVRLGVRAPNDPRILSTLRIYENPANGIAGVDSRFPNAQTYRRYNKDAYGQNHQGGFWPILAGERGHLAVAQRDMARANAQLFLLENSASYNGLIPEQTLGTTGPVAPGVASPLVWAHAEDILLHRSLEDGSVFDEPLEPNQAR